jgi:branched-chain amino acid transport system substrate-binding protein
LRLYSADNACTPDGGVSSTRELAELQRVKALLGAGCSGPTLSSLPLLIEFGIPQVTIGSTNLQITEEGNPWEFRVNANDETFAQAFSKFIAGEVSTVSLLVLNNEYGLGSEDAFRRYLDELGVEVLGSEYFERGQADYRSALTSIKAQNPEGLIFIGAAADGNIFFRQFRELGMNQKVYTRGAVSAELADLIADDPSLAEGAKDVTYYGTGGNPEFDERFRARWGVLPTFSAGAAYCGTVVLADAIERAGSDDSVAIRDALKTTDYDCTDILGPIKFDEKGQAKSHIYITGMEAGKIIVVDVIKDY